MNPVLSTTEPQRLSSAEGGNTSTADQLAAKARSRAESLRGLEELRYALDQAAIVATTDHRGIITDVNDKFCQISKYSRQELVGQDHRIINSGYHSKEFMRELWQTIARGDVWRGELRNKAKDGSFYWVDTTIVPFLDASGKPRQYLAIRSDITARKRAEAQLREQAALKNLGQIAAVVAHEIRNPLAGLRASLQVFERRLSESPDRGVISAMIGRIDSLNEKVEDLLLYARPKLPRLQAIPVCALSREIAGAARATAGNLGPAIAVTGDDAWHVCADADMLRAALLNLAINACQAAREAAVDIEVSAAGGTCRVAVRDRGPGISPDVRDRMFEPFFTTRPGGTGLGLAIVKRLLEIQEGSIALIDRPGGGTIAEVTLPLAR
jgi:PAS domain S-box-containing protein